MNDRDCENCVHHTGGSCSVWECSYEPIEDDLVSRQDAVDVAKQHWYKPDIAKASEELPSAQPEIIHCCECKWLQCNMRPDGYLPKGVDEFECRHWCGYCDPMDYCSYAERREG